MTDVQDVFSAVTPRQDVLVGELRDEVFAAQLEAVAAGTAEEVYQDPTEFFARTYPTAGMRTVLTAALGRLSGRGRGSAVLRLETSFGGGKTHTLIALWHLARGARPIGVESYVDPEVLPAGPVDVGVVVGTALDPKGVAHPDGITTRTVWGELAHQLGTYEAVADSDRDRTAPGTGTIARMLGDRPVLILLDELARYLAVAAGERVGDSNLGEQTVAFLMALFEHVGARDGAAVVWTLASSTDAFADRTSTLVDRLLGDARSVGARVSQVLTTTEENEIGAIVTHRLFARVEPQAAKAVAAAYMGTYRDALARGGDLPESAELDGYRADIEATYPLHPELLRALNEKVGSIPNFQRTRGALRLLARVVRRLWDQRPPGTLMIHTHHVDLSDPDIVAELTSRLDRPQFQQVIETDIVNPMQGSHAHATEVDRALVASGKPPYATRVATTVLLHSLVQAHVGGVLRPEANLAVLCPGDDLGLIVRQTDALLERAFYLHSDGDRLRFATEPSLNAVVSNEIRSVTVSAAKTHLDTQIRAIWPTGVFRPVFFPDGPADVEDTMEAPRLVIISYDAATVTEQGAENPPDLVIQIADRAGTSGSPRRYRNMVVFLVADTDGITHAVEVAREVLALERLTTTTQRMSGFNRDQQKELRNRLDDARLRLRTAITRAYRYVYYPSQDAPAARGRLALARLAPQDQGEPEQDQTRAVVRTLRDLQKVRTGDDPPPAPTWIRDKAWTQGRNRISTRELQRAFAERISLPILADLNLLKASIRQGITNGVWLYYDPADGCAHGPDSPAPPPVKLDDQVELIDPDHAEGVPLCGAAAETLGEDTAAAATCPVCGNPTDACTCGTTPPRVPVVVATGHPAEALTRARERAVEDGVRSVSAVEIRVHADTSGGLPLVLQNLVVAVPRARGVRVGTEVDVTVETSTGHVRVELRGTWVEWRRYYDLIKTTQGVTAASCRVALRFDLDSAAGPDDPVVDTIREALEDLHTEVEVRLIPATEEVGR